MFFDSWQNLRTNISQVVIGKENVLEFVMIGLLAEGHILIDDVPGVGKTLMAKALAASLSCDFRRVQFTPDLTPTDITGFFIYDRKTNDFSFRSGPVMTNILLADEINRTVPRTQSSLLEAMEEKQITVDGQTFSLPRPFLVLATQNPIEFEGTFPLPEAQLDRFLLKIKMGYPLFEEEEKILTLHGARNPLSEIAAKAGIDDILSWQEECHKVRVHPHIEKYIVSLVRATREHSSVALGGSPRASLALYRAAQALALIRNRDYVIPDDIKYLIHPVLDHRLILHREDKLRGLNPRTILDDILLSVPAPQEEGENRA